MEQIRAEHPDFSSEHTRSQEIIALEHRVMQKYFNLAGIPEHMVGRWIEGEKNEKGEIIEKSNGEALRKLADNEPEFLYEFLENKNATAKEFEEKLAQYH